MNRLRHFVLLVAICGLASLALFLFPSTKRIACRGRVTHCSISSSGGNEVRSPQSRLSRVSLPLTLESNAGQADAEVQFLARGQNLLLCLTSTGIDVQMPSSTARNTRSGWLRIGFAHSGPRLHRRVNWHGEGKVRSESNYLIGRDPRHWHTHVPHFARAIAQDVLPGTDLVAYGSGSELEFDVRLAPGTDVERISLNITGAGGLLLDEGGDLLIRVGEQQMRMRRPAVYEDLDGGEAAPSRIHRGTPKKSPLAGGYVLRPDGSVGFRVGKRTPHSTLVIDPSLSVEYSTFLGGTGEESGNSIALDSSGKVYVGGTTTSTSSFTEPATNPNSTGGGVTDFFVAKIDPSVTGLNSLVYLTFLGGGGNENGGLIAIDKTGDVAITGTTTSPDYPVTDGSKLTTGPNDVAVTEIDPTGAALVYSTLFGGSGSESTQNTGGIALDQAGDILIATDTTSKDLAVTPGAFQIANGGGISDGFLAVFRPVPASPLPHLKYCTYLGIDAQVGVGGIAIDAGDNAYIAGFTTNPGSTFPAVKAFQATYAGDPFDAFVIKIRPSGTGASDLAYGTFLGGAGLDKALAIAVGAAMPATAYVTGTTQSTNFPTNGAGAAAQTSLKGTADAFLAVIPQDPLTGMTSLAYSTYLGGTQSDSGLAVTAAAPNAIYITGGTTSWDFPWEDNFQPFNGDEDGFVVKFDPTSSGAASVVYATPLGGTAPPGGRSVSDGNAVAVNGSGGVFVAGHSTAADFPRAGNPGNGFQLTCASCQQLPAGADAFLTMIQENTTVAPSVSFTALKINFGSQPVGAENIPPLFAAAVNTGDSPLTISSFGISGPNQADFSLVGTDPCIGTQLMPHATCSFEVSFTPTQVGPEEGMLAVSDDAPGSPQLLALVGVGNGPLAVPSTTSIDFGSQPVGSTSNARTITLFNQGNQDLHVSNVTPIGGPDPGQFLQPQSDTCFAVPIPPGANCIIALAFAPTAVGTFHAEIDIVDDSGGTPGSKQAIALSGMGIAAAPIVNVLPASLTFANQPIGTVSGSQTVTLRNQGSAPLTLSQIGFVGTDAASFEIVATGSSPCPISGGLVAIGSACTVAVAFAPLTSGPKSASLSFVDNASGSPQMTPLTGTAFAPQIQFSPTSLTFAPQSVGTASPQQDIAIKNPGTSPVAISQIVVNGTNAVDFSETTNCPPVLAAGGDCVLGVTFKPTAPGSRAAAVVINDNAPESPQSLPLTGNATQSALSLSPSTLAFSGQLAGTASAQATVSVRNSGTGALGISAVSFSGVNPSDFSETDSCKGTIASGTACSLQVTFDPAAAGARSATLLITDNAPDSPQSVSLTGSATDFVINPQTPSGTFATVTAGQTANYQLDVQSLNGFAGSVILSCAGVPAETTCSMAPPTLSVSANASSPFQVNIVTTAPVAARARTDRDRSNQAKGSIASPLMSIENLLITSSASLFVGFFVLALGLWMIAVARRVSPEPQSERADKGPTSEAWSPLPVLCIHLPCWPTVCANASKSVARIPTDRFAAYVRAGALDVFQTLMQTPKRSRFRTGPRPVLPPDIEIAGRLVRSAKTPLLVAILAALTLCSVCSNSTSGLPPTANTGTATGTSLITITAAIQSNAASSTPASALASRSIQLSLNVQQ